MASDKRLYESEVQATIVTATPISPAIVNISAIPRSGPVPNQLPIQSAPRPSVIVGMNTASAIGAIRNAVNGDAAFSTIEAKPNTRP